MLIFSFSLPSTHICRQINLASTDQSLNKHKSSSSDEAGLLANKNKDVN